MTTLASLAKDLPKAKESAPTWLRGFIQSSIDSGDGEYARDGWFIHISTKNHKLNLVTKQLLDDSAKRSVMGNLHRIGEVYLPQAGTSSFTSVHGLTVFTAQLREFKRVSLSKAVSA